MALANFFDKVNLGASQILKSYDRTSFEEKLLSNCIGIVYDQKAVESFEGRAILNLLTRLVSRLYPKLRFISLCKNETTESFTEQLKSTALQINPVIDLGDEVSPTVSIVVGRTSGYTLSSVLLYVGSNNWNALFSTTQEQGCGTSHNPFGAASAACIALANLFRIVFKEELDHLPLDSDTCFSSFHQQVEAQSLSNPELPEEINIRFTLVGTGAIGNAALWSLLQLTGLKGQVGLIDNQTVALSNLQRYVLMDQNHVDKTKVDIIRKLFEKHLSINVKTYPEKWQYILPNLPQEEMEILAIALDTKEERICVQGVLPKKILNAWTSPDNLGISRHLDFATDPCLACIYLPAYKTKGESEKIADALGMQEQELFIRGYIANRQAIDDNFIAVVHQFTQIDPEVLAGFKGQQVPIFYSEGLCGGRVVPMSDKANKTQEMEVPLAHESVFAGILLAAEVIIECLQLRSAKIEPVTKINLMRPLHPYLRESEEKHYSGRCICQDEIYQERYLEKWM